MDKALRNVGILVGVTAINLLFFIDNMAVLGFQMFVCLLIGIYWSIQDIKG